MFLLLIEILLKHELVKHHLLLSLLLIRLKILELHWLILIHLGWTLFFRSLKLLHVCLHLVQLIVKISHKHIIVRLIKTLSIL